MSPLEADDPTNPDLTPEQREQAEQMAREFGQARQAILEADPSTIIANHAFGIYELAALHVTSEDPDLVAARLAIDALGALLEGVKGRLGEAEPTLLDALHNIKLGYVQRAAARTNADAPSAETASGETASTDSSSTQAASTEEDEDEDL